MIPGPKTITVVASMKMIVVIPNTNMCPGEWNKDPLELQERKDREGGEKLSERPNVWGNEKKSTMLTEES